MQRKYFLLALILPLVSWPLLPSGVGTAAAAQQITLEAKEFSFSPDRVSTRRPGRMTFLIKNVGEFPHGVKIEGVPGGIARIEPGQTGEVSFTLEKGKYTLYCPLRGHRERGMEARLGVGVKASQKAPAPTPPGGLY